MDSQNNFMDEISQRLFSYQDANNNSKKIKGDKYSLRPRSLRRGDDEEETNEITKKQSRRNKTKPAPLSKYRRKTANARERTRMREINAAFETLRRCVPSVPAPTATANEKHTKITTLRLAMRYINALSTALREDSSDTQTITQDLGDLLSDCSDFDCLLLESDGESLPVSDNSLTPDMTEHCLTPVNLNLNFEQFTDQSLSPTFPDHSLSPFDSLFPDFS